MVACGGPGPWLPHLVLLFSCLLLHMLASKAPQVLAQGECANSEPYCPVGMCCSIWGFCGNTPGHCSPDDCAHQCPPPAPPAVPPPPAPPRPPSPPPSSIGSIITEDLYREMFPRSLSAQCPNVNGFYTYNSFLEAARYFPEFGSVGDQQIRLREVAAFLGQVSQETTGGTPGAPDQFLFGLCFREELAPPIIYCQYSIQYPCEPGKSYHGRGPIQLSWNFNYGLAGDALDYPFLQQPELVAEDAFLSWLTALWFWMTPQDPKPSCHAVMIGSWEPTPADIAANRLPGFGMTTNIINGGHECGQGYIQDAQAGRIAYFRRYLDILGGTEGNNVDCASMQSYPASARDDAHLHQLPLGHAEH